MSYLFVITLSSCFSLLSRLLVCVCVCVREGRDISQSACPSVCFLSLRFSATRYLLLLSGRRRPRRSWPPSSSPVCHGGVVQYRGRETDACLSLSLSTFSPFLSAAGIGANRCTALSAAARIRTMRTYSHARLSIILTSAMDRMTTRSKAAARGDKTHTPFQGLYNVAINCSWYSSKNIKN